MEHAIRIENVIYDAAQRRFMGQVRVGGPKNRLFHISTPGHPAWGYRRIATAMAQKAYATFKAAQALPRHS